MIRLREEHGFAMPVAVSVLALCLVLTALVAGSADSLSRSSGEDQRAKRALAAADAGVAVALRRLRSMPWVADTVALPHPGKLANDECLTDAAVNPGPPAAAAGECPGYTEDLGGGASFTYHVTPASTIPGGCYEVPGTVIPANHVRRCITSTGTVNDVTRRVQRQVVAPPPAAGHWRGIVGTDYVEVRNSAHLSACHSTDDPGPMIASNLMVTVDNGSVFNAGCPAKVWGIEMPPGYSPSIHPGAQPSGAIPVRTMPGPLTIPPPPVDWEAVENTNANGLVSGYTGSGISWNANPNQRRLAVATGGSITFTQGGDYSFCTLSLANGANIDFATSQPTRIFIDSPSRPDSRCATSAVSIVNSARINWPASVSDSDVAALSARAKNLEIYVYGNDVLMDNSVRLAGKLQAERNTIHLVNSSLTWGAVAGKRIIVENSGNFNRPDGIAGHADYGLEYKSKGWAQCRSAPSTPADPESGCS